MAMVLLLAHAAVASSNTTKALIPLLLDQQPHSVQQWAVLRREWPEPSSPATRKKVH